MAAARKEEERNERIVRGLLRLPPNRRCINCGGLGPQYVCTNFWTFVCISCSGIHREFTHRVKSVSMSKFTVQEVEALQKGGNQRARELFLKDFDDHQMRLPDNSNIESLRGFIKDVYMERKYADARFSERPPRDKQNEKTHEEEHRRASSYHSFSQNPPYDYQYEERHNGKLSAMLTRKPGSDHGHDEKTSGFAYSSRSLRERMSKDRFANESFASRTSDCSGSSMGEMYKTAPQSPNLHDNGCFSPPMQPGTDIQTSMGITQPKINVSTASSFKSDKSSLSDVLFEPDNALGTQQTNNSIAPSFVAFSNVANAAKEDLLSEPVAQQKPAAGLHQPVDLFANMPPITPSGDSFAPAALSVENTLWATFDTSPGEKQPGVTELSHVAAIGKEKQTLSHDLFLFEPNDQQAWFQSSKDNASVTNQSIVPSCKDETPKTSSFQPWSAFDATNGNTKQHTPGDFSFTSLNPQEPKGSMDGNSSQFWYSFDDVSGIMAHNLSTAQLQTNECKNTHGVSITASNPFTCSISPKSSHSDDSQQFCMDGLAHNAPFVSSPEPSVISSAEGASTDQTILNPFDFPCDADAEAQDSFMDVSALHAALPNPDLPTSFIDGLAETWFSNYPSTYVSSGPNGGLSYLVEQVPNSLLRNLTLGTVSTGNPFA